MTRTCFYISGLKDEKGFIPSVITEGAPGHSPLTGSGAQSRPWHWGQTMEEARATCDRLNAEQGITPDEALDILMSSMRS